MAVPYLPPEIMSRIFGWIHPHTVYKLRRISKGLNSLISSGAFGRENLAHFFSAPTTSDAITSSVANEFDCLFFKLPVAFRTVYAEKYLSKLTHIDWNHEAEMAAELPREIRLLSNLKTLVITSSQLRGSIPKELGLMSKLNYVGLWENAFTGEIPHFTCPQLRKLLLFSNRLTGCIPQSICRLTELTELYLHDNCLSGPIPCEIGCLVNLRALMLDHNSLDGPIPHEIGNLPNLTGLYLDHNQLSGALPAEFGNLGELLYASLNNNRLTGAIPSAVTNLRNLERFDLRDNAGLTCDFSFEVMQL
ncbi:hypothetical protein CcCBS67573_g01055 [Chytriomyces confervae]|uniref:F-box domain-containing protein n=1 Tax=Chytriomyces confervae TaxID=246404 RepID=A0A507FMV9_9FUNG|nr:hypothetical protein HDU80_011454 [Chytriomyces hyalinus]TPX77664.1 hypothetical protein CcCBS67573_g01055 [Chytriomyces confervae]